MPQLTPTAAFAEAERRIAKAVKTGSKTLNLNHLGLTSVPESLRKLEKLQALFLHDNPALKLPKSVLGPTYEEWSGDYDDAPKPGPILDYYFRTRRVQDRRPLGEAKLILVGRGEVGKTSLVKRLVDNKFSRREDRTQGIRIKPWPLTIKKGEEVRLHVWDFGGQEIMHATHQFFLTDRSVYLLVLDGRAGQQEAEADYWLRIISSFAPESPVIVVLNKIQKDPLDLNRLALQEKFPQIKGFFETDCDNPDSKGKPGADGHGIETLQKAIVREVKQMPDVRAVFPASWFGIKEKLSKTQRNYLSFDEYRAFCDKHGEPDAGAQESLATHLHRLGIALNFRDDPRLRDTHVLNPHWVTEGIYALLNSQRLADRKGELHLADLQEELDARRYPADMHQFLLDLMEKFELCFSFPDGKRYLIPELLEAQQPKEAAQFDPQKCLNFQYHYPVLPTGLLPRFIVRTHMLSEKQPRWRTGVILDFEGNTALVKADLQDRRVSISINGPLAGRRRMLAVIREDFEYIHRGIQHLNPAEMVPLPAHPQIVVPYRDLEVLERKDPRSIWQQVIENDVSKIPVSELLDGVDLKDQSARVKEDGLLAAGMRPDAKGMRTDGPIRVFYSYAHADAKQRNTLSKHLAPIKRLDLITDWYDHEILPGEKWSEAIDSRMQEAEIVLFLISPDFVDSKYCYEIELKAAMQKNPEQSAVIPIILTHFNSWDKLPMGRLNALPDFGKPISKWNPRGEGWANVAAGIERIARDLLQRRQNPKRPDK